MIIALGLVLSKKHKFNSIKIYQPGVFVKIEVIHHICLEASLIQSDKFVKNAGFCHFARRNFVNRKC